MRNDHAAPRPKLVNPGDGGARAAPVASPAWRPPACTTSASGCSPASPSASGGSIWRASRPPCSRAATGPELVLLHGPRASAAHWLRVIPDLVTTHRVVIPDLPGHGASVVSGELDAARVVAWLRELIEHTCDEPPALVGYALGGALAARFAGEHGRLLERAGARRHARPRRSSTPAPEFGPRAGPVPGGPERGHPRRALAPLRARPRRAAREHGGALGAVPRVQRRAGAHPERTGGRRRPDGGVSATPADLDRIAMPTSLIWGRDDLATPLAVARPSASATAGRCT